MNFITYSNKAIKEGKYYKLHQPHILISIANPNKRIDIPLIPQCKEQLFLEFYDVEDLEPEYITFDKDMAKRILDFVNSNINQVNTIAVNCQAGVSRSVAVAAALSKIINYKDDDVFSLGIPNMLVYTTILDTYFSERDYSKKWSKIFYVRKENMNKCISPILQRMHDYKLNNRIKGEFDERE